MTTTQRNASKLRGEALTQAIALSRSGAVIDSVAAAQLAREMYAPDNQAWAPAIVRGVPERVFTSGGAVVTFVPHGNDWTVSVSASPI